MNPRVERKGGATLKLGSGVAACLLAAGLIAGCTSARSDLGTSDSPCFLALPAATKAAGPHSRFSGVHLYTLASLQKKAPHLYQALSSEPASSQRICAIAFSGTFTRTSVSHPLGLASGSVAVVVLKTPSNQLLGTVIFNHAPVRFGHTHTG
ncbi:MAG TPA: hypothetical protein VG205_04825 [Acidimicrobiales bacterium]|jgi:hypothetical protein|nr:hypothetical protein [Acidimicrobiales bacterium]